MTEEGQRLLELMRDYFTPVIGPAAGGALGFFAGSRKRAAEAVKLEAEADAVQMDSITRQFQALINAYEKRIEDLTTEIHSLRAEVSANKIEIIALRKALDRHPRAD